MRGTSDRHDLHAFFCVVTVHTILLFTPMSGGRGGILNLQENYGEEESKRRAPVETRVLQESSKRCLAYSGCCCVGEYAKIYESSWT